MDRSTMTEAFEFELQMCEKCGAVIGTKKHLLWLYEKLGPLAYTNPSLLLAKSGQLIEKLPRLQQEPKPQRPIQASDFMKILCPKCKCELNIRL